MKTPLDRLRNLNAAHRTRVDKAVALAEKMRREAEAAEQVSRSIKSE